MADNPNPAGAMTEAIARELVGNLTNLTKSATELKVEIDGLKKELKEQGEKMDTLKAADNEAIVKRYEELKAGFDRIVKTLRAGSRGANLPGLEDEVEKFSLIRAGVAMRTGDWKGAKYEEDVLKQMKEKAAQVTDVGWRGGYFLNEQIMADVVAAVYARSVWVASGPDGAQTRISVIDGMNTMTGQLPKFSGGTLAYWIGEEENYIQSMVQVKNIELKLRKLGVLTKLTKEMRLYGGFGFENLLRNDMIRNMQLKLDWTIGYGTGSDGMPRGIVKAAGVKKYSCKTGAEVTAVGGPGTSVNLGDEFNYDDADEMMQIVGDQDFAFDGSEAFVMPFRGPSRLRRLKVANYANQSDMMPYLLGIPRLSDAKLQEMLGAPFAKSTKFPSKNTPGQSLGWASDNTNQKYGDVMFGRWSDLVLVRGLGFDVDTDDGKGLGFTNDTILLKMTGYFDVAFRNPEAIVVCPDAQMRN